MIQNLIIPVGKKPALRVSTSSNPVRIHTASLGLTSSTFNSTKLSSLPISARAFHNSACLLAYSDDGSDPNKDNLL